MLTSCSLNCSWFFLFTKQTSITGSLGFFLAASTLSTPLVVTFCNDDKSSLKKLDVRLRFIFDVFSAGFGIGTLKKDRISVPRRALNRTFRHFEAMFQNPTFNSLRLSSVRLFSLTILPPSICSCNTVAAWEKYVQYMVKYKY